MKAFFCHGPENYGIVDVLDSQVTSGEVKFKVLYAEMCGMLPWV